jgi:hypothetical protein
MNTIIHAYDKKSNRSFSRSYNVSKLFEMDKVMKDFHSHVPYDKWFYEIKSEIEEVENYTPNFIWDNTKV